ncbi:clumping factor A [Nematostella vectensis]|uniref:clumping factor A n=1 Tax=Nematostella vectensis TaxID=45351 RepID=UPI00139063A0|nr:clumping factor A [Nematostella vectensis]XP_032220647.1 clumping factor A [Nematostella vectensis]
MSRSRKNYQRSDSSLEEEELIRSFESITKVFSEAWNTKKPPMASKDNSLSRSEDADSLDEEVRRIMSPEKKPEKTGETQDKGNKKGKDDKGDGGRDSKDEGSNEKNVKNGVRENPDRDDKEETGVDDERSLDGEQKEKGMGSIVSSTLDDMGSSVAKDSDEEKRKSDDDENKEGGVRSKRVDQDQEKAKEEGKAEKEAERNDSSEDENKDSDAKAAQTKEVEEEEVRSNRGNLDEQSTEANGNNTDTHSDDSEKDSDDDEKSADTKNDEISDSDKSDTEKDADSDSENDGSGTSESEYLSSEESDEDVNEEFDLEKYIRKLERGTSSSEDDASSVTSEKLINRAVLRATKNFRRANVDTVKQNSDSESSDSEPEVEPKPKKEKPPKKEQSGSEQSSGSSSEETDSFLDFTDDESISSDDTSVVSDEFNEDERVNGSQSEHTVSPFDIICMHYMGGARKEEKPVKIELQDYELGHVHQLDTSLGASRVMDLRWPFTNYYVKEIDDLSSFDKDADEPTNTDELNPNVLPCYKSFESSALVPSRRRSVMSGRVWWVEWWANTSRTDTPNETNT